MSGVNGADVTSRARAIVEGTVVEVVVGDLTQMEVDAIVNAANRDLQHGGGVAAAIANAGGPSIQEESDRWIDEHGPLDEGQAAVTSGGDLPAQYVVHTAGPVYDDDADDNEQQLRAAVRGALDAGHDAGARSMAFPAVSAGVYGYPPAEATAILADEVVTWLRDGDGRDMELVRMVALDDEMADHFDQGLRAAVGD